MAAVEVTIGAYQGAVVDQIKAAFPVFQTVEFDREETDRDEIDASDLPAILLDLTEFENESDDDRGTGQIPLRCRLEARILLGYKTTAAKTAARTAAANLALFLRLKRFTADGVKTEPAVVIGSYRDDFASQDRYTVWRVEWTQVLQVGADIFYSDTLPVPEPVYSFSPDIGHGHEADYEHLFENAGRP